MPRQIAKGRGRWTLAAVVGFAASLSAIDAQAYCRTTTCNQTIRPAKCGPVPVGACETEGEYLRIESAAISYSIDMAGSLDEGITSDQLAELVREIFDTWQSADCGGGRSPSVRFDAYPKVSCDQVELSWRGPNQNVWTFVDEGWLDRGGQHSSLALALTTVQFNKDDGRIYGADVEINSDLYDFTLDALDDSRHDLRGILQHESGHYFGLAHSFAFGATMQTYATRTSELEIRTLDDDDIDGICAIYPPGTDVSERSSEPLGGFSTECASDSESGACCSLGVGRRAARQRDGWLMLVAWLCYALRRFKLVEPIVSAQTKLPK